MPLRSVALVAAICVTIGWLLASTLTPPVARVQSRPEPTTPAALADDVVPFTEQVQLRLHEIRPTPVGRRNPFVFATRERSISAEASQPQVVPIDAIEQEPRPIAPAYVLAGIGISGDTRTAVLASGNDVHVVKPNDVVGGFTVTEITAHSVTLTRDAERHVLRLAH
jgi:hypothetical protein